MRSLVFDTGPIISLAINSLLFIIEPLQKKFKGDFIIPESVKQELIDKPLKTKRFQFEALRVLSRINNEKIRVVESPETRKLADEIMDLANNCFKAKGKWIKIVHYAEIEALATAINLKASALVVDERTTRVLVENPERLEKILERKLHTDVVVNKNNLDKIKKMTKDIKMIRSTELAVVAYELGLLDRFLPAIPNPNKMLLESVLWGLKLNGCSINEREIKTIIKEELK